VRIRIRLCALRTRCHVRRSLAAVLESSSFSQNGAIIAAHLSPGTFGELA